MLYSIHELTMLLLRMLHFFLGRGGANAISIGINIHQLTVRKEKKEEI